MMWLSSAATHFGAVFIMSESVWAFSMKKMVTITIATAILMTFFVITHAVAVRPDIQIVGGGWVTNTYGVAS